LANHPTTAPYTTLNSTTHPHVSPNHNPIALPTPPSSTTTFPSPQNLTNHNAKNKNGYPNPSFAPLSATINLCNGLGTFPSANLPFTITADSTGSVGVTHAPMARACSSGRGAGTSAHTSRLVASHMAVMTGPTRRRSGRQWWRR
jgi:hypothetical protein